ncbi:kelch-like protein 8 [Gigantopelta aegis]|uniref:kelch-like protein 8 n=1 Tax=Gigantopelta aegis TaxID=1735272 RepID=UPI001B88CCD4|nr:kelch-like protein 8 [Gigantopelta aegis]
MEDIHTQLLVSIHQEIIKGSFCDIQIVCKDGTTTGSRLVLAALSPYFRAMLSSDMAESRTGVLNLPSVPLSAFQDIIKMYFCKINIVTEDNCMQVLDAAEMMQLDYIKQLCNSYLQKGLVLTSENCLSWWRLLKLYNFLDLSEQAFCYLTKHFTNFIATENVIQLSKAELLEIISKHDLDCEEDSVMKCSLKWIETNNPDPDDIRAIFENVRLEIVDPQFLIDKVVFSTVVCQNTPLQQMIQHVLHTYHQRVTPWPRIKSRINLNSKHHDVFVLLHDKKSLLSCFTSDDKWEDVPPAPVDPGQCYSAASLDNKIYITGGQTLNKCTLIYDTIRKEWKAGSNLNQEHSCHCMATACSKVFVIGGFKSNTIEHISKASTQWQVVADLGMNRRHGFALTVGKNIVIMGGGVNSNNSDVIQHLNTTTYTVSSLNTQLPCKSSALRGSVHLPDVYLLDKDGNVMHIQITDIGGEIQIQSKTKAKWKSFDYYFGVKHCDGSLLCFTTAGIRKFNLAEGKEEACTLPTPPSSSKVYNVLTFRSDIQ